MAMMFPDSPNREIAVKIDSISTPSGSATPSELTIHDQDTDSIKNVDSGNNGSSEFIWILLIFLVVGLPCAVHLQNPKIDEDSWWHLAVGKEIIHTGKIPDRDPFSQLGLEEPRRWIAYSWLYELVLYGFYSLFGLSGIILFRVLLVNSVLFCWSRLFLRGEKESILYLLVYAGLTASYLLLMSERSWHFTILFTSITLYVIEQLHQGRSWKNYLWLPGIYILWANIHVQFVMGLGLLGLAWLHALIISGIRERFSYRTLFKASKSYLILLITCLIATVINPFGVDIYRVIFEYATEVSALRHVVELVPPDPTVWHNWVPWSMLLLAVIQWYRRGRSLWGLLLWLCAVFFTMRMQRDMWFGALIAAYLILPEQRHGEFIQNRSALRRRSTLLLQVGCTVIAYFLAPIWIKNVHQIDQAQEKYYPLAALNFIRSQNYPGPIFNEFSWGGFLIWNLPEYPVSIDGRTNLYGDTELERSFNTWAGFPSWQTDPALIRAQFILAPKTQELTNQLMNSDWKLTYEDELCRVFVR